MVESVLSDRVNSKLLPKSYKVLSDLGPTSLYNLKHQVYLHLKAFIPLQNISLLWTGFFSPWRSQFKHNYSYNTMTCISFSFCILFIVPLLSVCSHHSYPSLMRTGAWPAFFVAVSPLLTHSRYSVSIYQPNE